MAELVLKSKSSLETEKISSILAEEIVKSPVRGAFVLALEGNLGSGKTTFVQGFARELGIKENVLSPTFVLMKVYDISQTSLRGREAAAAISGKGLLRPASSGTRNDRLSTFRHMVHIDCYRVKSPQELAHIGFKNLLKDKDAVILIEWADRIKKLLPKDIVWVKFQHGRRPNERIIKIKN